MTQGIKQMEAMGFIVSSIKHDRFNSRLVRQFIKYDDKGYITDTINYYYTKVTGVEVYTNSLKYGGGSRLDIELLNAIQLNLDELKIEYELNESLKSARYAKKLTEATANYAMSSKGFKTYVYREDPSGYHIPHEVKGSLYDEAYKIALRLVDEDDEDFNNYLFDVLRDLEQEYLSEEEYIFNDYYNNIKRVLDDFLYFYIGNVMDKLESSEHFDKILKERDISVYEVGNFIKEEYDIEIKDGYYSGFSIVIKKHDYMGPEYMGEDLVDEINRLVKEEIETNLYPKLEAEGLIPIKVQARFSTGETMYELDESLKSAGYTKKLTEAKERVKRYSYYEIDEEVYEVDMWEIWYRDRNTQHIRITNRAGDVYKDKITYYNRTWERFEYQKVLLKLLNKMYKDEKLVDRIAKQVETNMRYVINETSQQGNNKKELEWLLSLPDGFLVAISACRGKDCSRTDELEKRLRRKNYIRVVGKWDGIEETSFLVFTESESMARALVKTGIYKFNQDDVYVWKTPMTMADIIEGTDEGTKLDGKYYYFDLDKIIMSRDNVKEK